MRNIVWMVVMMGMGITLACAKDAPALKPAPDGQAQQPTVEAAPAEPADTDNPHGVKLENTSDEDSAPADTEEGRAAADMDKDAAPAQESRPAMPPRRAREVKAPAAPQKFYHAESFILPPEWGPDGTIIGDRERKLLISNGDTVYISVGSAKVKPGMQCFIYRRMSQVKDPDTKELIGYEMRRIGKLELTDAVGEKVSSAMIVVSYEPIEINDMVKVIKK